MRGDVKTFAELVEVAEKVQKRKWLKKSTPIEELEATSIVELGDPRKIQERCFTTKRDYVSRKVGGWWATT